ncbi:MAG: hypothetical protein ACXWDI_12650 [Nocardioides sp.]
MYFSRNMPCAECGASVPRTDVEAHECDPQRRVDFQILGMTAAIACFESDIEKYLSGKEGRFEVWLAARDVRRGRLTGS